MAKFLDKTGLDTFWAKIKSTFQTLGNLVTAWGSTPSDTKYPSEKLVKDSLDGKQATLLFDGTYNASTNKAATVSTVTNAISGLDVSSVGGNGKYISAISETDGKISATATTMDTTPTANSTNAVTSGGMKTALDGKMAIYTSGSDVPSSQNFVCLQVSCPYVSGVDKTQLLLFDVTSFADGTIVNNGAAYVGFSGFLIGGKPQGGGEKICVKLAAKVAYSQITTSSGFRTLKSDSATCGPEIVKRTENGVDKYYLSIFYDSTLFSGNNVLVGQFMWRKPTNIDVYSYSNGVIGIYYPNETYPDGEPLWERLQSWTSNIASQKLFTARKLKTNLARTADSTFDGSADQTNIPVTGTLPVGNGGTGKTTAKAAEYNLTTGKSEISDATSGDDRVVFELASPSESNGVTRGFRKLSTIWTWIKGLLSSESGVNISGSSASCTGNAATASAAQSGSALETAINGKVDKETGKGLSTNDYTTTEKNKLAGIAEGATKVEASTTNGKVKINGTDTTVYTHPSQTAYTSKGTATKVPQITTDGTGHVTGITEVTISGVTPASHTHGNIQNGGALQTNDITIASGDKLVVTDSSDSNKVARTSVSFDGSTTTKALTQKGTFETFLTSHQSITGKMNTSGDNAVAPSGDGGNGATATLLNNLTGPNSLDDITSDNVLIPTTNSDGTDQTKWYKRPLSKLWPWILSHTQSRILKTSSDVYWGVGADANHYIDLDYDGRTSSPTVGVWVRWASGSGNAKYMAECDASGNCTFNGTSTHARYAYNTYNPGSGTAYWLKIGRVTSPASSGSAGGALTAIISSGFNTAGDDLSAQLIRVSIRSKGTSTNGVTIVGDNVTLGLKSVVLNADVRFAVHTVTSRTTSVDGVYDIYVERKGWHYVDVLQLHNDNVEMTYNSDTTKAISDTTNMTIFSPTLPYASTAAVGNLLAVANAAGTGVTQYYMRAIEYTSGGTTYIALTKNDGTSNVRVKSAENADGCDGWKFKVGSLGTATDTIYFIAGS